MNFSYKKHTLQFKFEAGTSRGVLKIKTTYFIFLKDGNGSVGVGECGPLKGLSIDDRDDFEVQLKEMGEKITQLAIPNSETEISKFVANNIPDNFPSIQFGFELALLDLLHGGKRIIYKNDFSESRKGLAINGLIWMGDKEFMLRQIEEKLEHGYSCIKLKIGAIDFETECELLTYIRSKYSKEEVTLRVDANGAFSPDEAMKKLDALSVFDIHSIEQPIKQGQMDSMAVLCAKSPIPIALDEELIGIFGKEGKLKLLERIRPQYIILKPTLLGGFAKTAEWIDIAESLNIDWWITSALESNIGLNAVSQFTANYNVTMPQGLGTGQLYTNNIPAPLTIQKGFIYYDKMRTWDFNLLKNK